LSWFSFFTVQISMQRPSMQRSFGTFNRYNDHHVNSMTTLCCDVVLSSSNTSAEYSNRRRGAMEEGEIGVGGALLPLGVPATDVVTTACFIGERANPGLFVFSKHALRSFLFKFSTRKYANIKTESTEMARNVPVVATITSMLFSLHKIASGGRSPQSRDVARLLR